MLAYESGHLHKPDKIDQATCMSALAGQKVATKGKVKLR